MRASEAIRLERQRLGRIFKNASQTLSLGLMLCIVACAPALSVRDLEPSLSLSARNEVAWATGGDAFMALPPGYAPQKLASPGIVASIAWRDGAPWMALPGAGLVQRALGVPETVSVAGRPVRLSSKYIFTTASTVFGYGGAQIAQLPGTVRDVLETKDLSYVLIEAQGQGLVYRLGDDRATLVDRRAMDAARVNLVQTDLSYDFAPRPTARANRITYRAMATTLEAESRGSVVASAPLVAQPIAIAANDETVAVLSRSALEVFGAPRSGGSGLERLARIPFGSSP